MKERIQWIDEAKGIGIFAFDFIPYRFVPLNSQYILKDIFLHYILVL